MELGLLMFPSPTGSAGVEKLAEGLGFRSMVFADTQCLTPEASASPTHFSRLGSTPLPTGWSLSPNPPPPSCSPLALRGWG